MLASTARPWIHTLCLLGLLLAVAPAATVDARPAPADTETIVEGETGSALQAALRRAVPDFWGSVLVAREGEILLAEGHGMADGQDTPNTPATLHELASASKQITATAVLHLVQRGKLEADTPLGRIFDDVPEDKASITVHQLLAHTSGISSRIGVPYSSPLKRDAYVKRMLALPLSQAPGTAFEYSNVGYALAAAVVEEVSGTSFEAYVEKHLLGPAGMKDTGFIGDKDLKATGRASVRANGQTGKTAADWFWGWGYRGMGGTVSTVRDLLRWDRALRGTKILTEETKTFLHTPVLSGYACGWRVSRTERGTRKAEHSGSVAGYGANLVRWLEDDVLIAVLSNNPRHAWQVTAALEGVLFSPLAVEISVDASRHGGGGKLVEVTEDLAWKASRRREGVRVVLRQGKQEILQMDLPTKGYAAKLREDLLQAHRTRSQDPEAERPEGSKLSLYLQGSARSGTLTVPRGSVAVMPLYRGQTRQGEPVIDKRVCIVVKDLETRRWIGLARMELSLADALRKALGKILDR